MRRGSGTRMEVRDRRRAGRAAIACAVLVALAACAPSSRPGEADAADARAAPDAARVLVFTRTEGWRHDSIPDAVAALRGIGAEAGLEIVHSEDPADLDPERLSRLRAVVFANTTGDVLDDARRAALKAFVRGGGGFLGVHSAADTEYGWPWYGGLVGSWFESHPPGLQTARATFADEGVAEEGRVWRVTDEFYNFRDNPRARVRVIATLETGDYEGSTMGEDHPIAWCHEYDGGRSWYTGLGHDPALYAQPPYLRHLARGLRYVTGLDDAC